MRGSANSSNSSGAGKPINSSTRYYELRRNCCLTLDITLCLHHLAERIHAGWHLDTDRGADNQPCYDCQLGEK